MQLCVAFSVKFSIQLCLRDRCNSNAHQKLRMQRTCVFDLDKQETRTQKFEVEQFKNKDARESRSMDLLGVSKLSQMQTTPNPATHSLCKPAKGLMGPIFKCSEPAEHQLGSPLLISFPPRCVC